MPHERGALRTQLLAQRAAWLSTPAAHAASAALGHHLREVLQQLEPQCLGLYWPLEGEFNAVQALSQPLPDKALGLSLQEPHEAIEDEDEEGDDDLAAGPALWSLPFAYKSPRRMDYRRWDGGEPGVKDECGIASSAGAVVVPDVVLVPCVGFTREGYRLGYGGGYYDRWLAAHPGVTSIGIAWQLSECHFPAEPHDQPLTLILTEREVISP